MKVLLLQDVKKLGKGGEVVEVSDGYARNFILPKKYGIEATKAVLNDWQIKKAAEKARKEKEEAEAIATAASINGKSITIKAKAGENGRLFGKVTAQDAANAVEAQLGLKVDKKKVIVPDDIKTIGEYTIVVRLMANAAANVNMKVVADA